MSKELEFFRKIKASILKQFTLGGIYKFDELNKIEKALTPPTADEVCEALSEYFDRNVYYESGRFLYRKEEFYNQPFIIAYKYKSGLVELTKNVLPPHLITLIGRFYEGLEKLK